MTKGKRVISAALSLVLAASIGFTSFTANAAGVTTKKPTIVKHTATKKVDTKPYLNMYLGSDPPSLDSTLATDNVSFQILGSGMECLTRQDKKGEDTINGPGAAEKWEVSPDGKVWTFYIRKMNWSDGKPVTAKDFEYSWLRLLDPNHGAEYAYFLYFIKGAEEYNTKKGSVANVGIRALSASKFQVTLKQPTPHFEKILSFGILSPVRKDIASKLGDKYGTNSSVKSMVWCGPYTISEWKLGQKLTITKNPKYWDAKNVLLTKVDFTLSELEVATSIQMFENKQLDQVGATKDWIEKLKAEAKTGKFKYSPDTSLTSRYLVFNVKDKYFKNAKIRKAFGLSIDRDAYTLGLFKRYVPSYAIVPSKIMAGDVDFRKYSKTTPYGDLMKEYPNAAAWKKLLVDGLKELKLDADPTKHTVEYVNYGSTSTEKMRVEFFQNQWQTKLGINVKIKSLADWGQFLKAQSAGECPICMAGWGPDYNDPMTYLDMWTNGSALNKAFYNNPKYDDLIAKAGKELNAAKRTEYMKQAERLLIYTDSAIAPINYDDVHRFIQNYVAGQMYFDFGADIDFKYAYTSGR